MKRNVLLVLAMLILLAMAVGCNRSTLPDGDGIKPAESAPAEDISPSPNTPEAYSGEVSDMIEEIAPSPQQATPQQVLRDAPERAPRLELVLLEGDSPEQRVKAIQLSTSWLISYDDGTGTGYDADSAHALQVLPDDFDKATLRLDAADSTIELWFSDNYPPQSVAVQRWNAEYATGRQDIDDVLKYGEPVEISENVINIQADGYDYVYEIYAKWENGSSYYTFRTENGGLESNDASSDEPSGLSLELDIQTEHYDYVDEGKQTDITVDYLRISGFSDMKAENQINKALEDIAWMDLGSPTEEGLYYNMQCDYSILAGRFLCARYYLQYYHQTAAHPWRSLNCITIDLETGRELTLTDIMAIDERIMQMLVERAFIHSIDGETEIIGLDEGILEDIEFDDFYWQISTFGKFTLSDRSVRLIVDVPHYAGDYWVLAFPYESLSELLYPWFSALMGEEN